MTEIPADRLRLELLGGFVLRDSAGTPVSLPTRKTEMLLAYLAVQPGQLHDRGTLASLFWDRSSPDQASGSLRKALSALRQALGPELLVQERGAVALAEGGISSDVDRLAARVSGPASLDPVPVREFLAGHKAPGSELDDWLGFERTRCRNHAQAVLMAQAEALLKAGRLPEALASARQLLALDTLHEESHRLIMRIHEAAGERPAALAQFRTLENILKRDLDVDPSPESLLLHRTIATGQPVEPAPAAPEADFRISIAVLAFQAGSDTEGQGEVAAGLSQDILTELSKRRDFMVIAPQSSFNLGATSALDAASQLGVRYVLSGSLRRAGGRVRITAQLTDAIMGRIIWAERYDRPAEDLFAIQDEVIDLILGATDAQIRRDERERVARRHPDSLDAWEAFHRGAWHAYRFTKADCSAAKAHFSRAIELAPGFAQAHAGLAYVDYVSVNFYFTQDPRAAIARGLEHAASAVALEDDDAFSHVALGRLLTLAGDKDRARHHLIRAVSLNPSYAQAHFGLAMADFWEGAPDQALIRLDHAERLSPRDPLTPMFTSLRAFCHLWLGDVETAEAMARLSISLSPHYSWSRLALSVSLSMQGRKPQAAEAVAEARRIDPNLTIASFNDAVGEVPEAFRIRVYAMLREAGMPEGDARGVGAS
jgi:TolB-like protein